MKLFKSKLIFLNKANNLKEKGKRIEKLTKMDAIKDDARARLIQQIGLKNFFMKHMSKQGLKFD